MSVSTICQGMKEAALPVPMLRNIARQYGLDLATVERYWNECRASAGTNYGAVVNCVKKRAAAKSKKEK